jgi:hypothetical protein
VTAGGHFGSFVLIPHDSSRYSALPAVVGVNGNPTGNRRSTTFLVPVVAGARMELGVPYSF